MHYITNVAVPIKQTVKIKKSNKVIKKTHKPTKKNTRKSINAIGKKKLKMRHNNLNQFFRYYLKFV